MNPLHAAAFIAGVLVGGFLGWRFASARNRNTTVWALVGAALPVSVVVLWFLEPLAAPAGDDDAETEAET